MGAIKELVMKELDADSVLSDETLGFIFDQEDEIYKARLLLSVQDRAEELGVLQKFKTLVGAYKKVEKQAMKSAASDKSLIENWTNFTGGGYDRMKCGSWIASDAGIIAHSFTTVGDIRACYHPILPVERLKNLETGDENIMLAYKRNNVWREITVPKDLVASANKIVALSKQGVAVTSENARHLVKYLSDVECLNDDTIPVQESTAKLGWHGDIFLPYDNGIIFDGNEQFRYVFDAIQPRGSETEWMQHVKELRASGKKQIKIALVASFASVLVSKLNALPFIVDFWGQSGSGKSLSAMLSASVWADPSENQYIGDFKTSEVGLEVRCDMLNHLPVILDDTSKVSNRIRDNFEGTVYDLCSGKGKTRSNKDLGLRRENRWCNCIITNGERPLRSYVQQGGAINRVLEVECLDGTYSDPAATVACLQKNYGHAGKAFIDVLSAIPEETIEFIRSDFQRQIGGADAVQKQSLALSILLTADKLTTEFIFKDGQYLTLEELEELSVSAEEVSDNMRAYEFLVDKIAMNAFRFDGTTNCEKWGTVNS